SSIIFATPRTWPSIRRRRLSKWVRSCITVAYTPWGYWSSGETARSRLHGLTRAATQRFGDAYVARKQETPADEHRKRTGGGADARAAALRRRRLHRPCGRGRRRGRRRGFARVAGRTDAARSRRCDRTRAARDRAHHRPP